MLCDASCDHSHIILYCLRNRGKRKEKKIDKRKIKIKKYKGSSIHML